MEFKGKVWVFGNDVNTDEIIPARYLNTSDPQELARHCMEDADPSFQHKVRKGDLIVAGTNFGCGSSREHAPIAIKAAGVSCVVAESFARIFYRNAYNMGLPILECPGIRSRVAGGDRIDVYLDSGKVVIEKDGTVLQTPPVPDFMRELIREGGLMNYVKKQTGLTV